MKIYNSLTKRVEDFKPINSPHVGMYTCGPTVYDYTHIGHLRKYTGDDILKRVLQFNNFQVKHVMNITDVGHLTSDEDQGDDKLEKGAKEKGLTVWELAKSFEEYFWKSLNQLNIDPPDIIAKATDHINEQIKLIERLEKNGFTYITDQAVYFDTSKFPSYGELTGQKQEDKQVGVRDDVVVDSQKKNPADFVLWFFTTGHFKDHVMRWPAPWGEGFPGWHIECSAMSMEYLGESFDIHTGGVDHLPIHHTNEIAQSEAATGKKFVNYWVHHEFLLVDGEKMSKSKKNFYTIDDIKEKGFDPLALRYLFLTAHYRDQMNFTFKSLQAAQNALNNLRDESRSWVKPTADTLGLLSGDNPYLQKFQDALNNDLNIPQALAVLWELVKSDMSPEDKGATALWMDTVLGLKLDQFIGEQIEVPDKVWELVNAREEVRKNKDFEKSDELRLKIKELGFEVLDTPSGPTLKHV
jgi:cysteinyl-tRNA synthetase